MHGKLTSPFPGVYLGKFEDRPEMRTNLDEGG